MKRFLIVFLVIFSINLNAVEGKAFTSYPVDASVTKDKFRWMNQAGAQRLVTSTQVTVSSVSVIYQKKQGVKLKVRVVNSITGGYVRTLGPFSAKADPEAASWEIGYLVVKLNTTLSPESYFVYPELLEGKLAYLPNYNRLNRVDYKFKISAGMYVNEKRGGIWEYAFNDKDVKSEILLNDYGPFLKWEITESKDLGEDIDTTRVKELMSLIGRDGQTGEVIPEQLTNEFKELNAAVKNNSGDKSAYNDRGAANSNIGNFSAAVRDFNLAIELDSSDVVALTNRGLTYAKMGEHELAMADFNRALSFEANDPVIFYIKGYVERQLGNYNAAINAFSKAIVFNPRDPLNYYMRGRTKMDQKDYTGALADFENALVINPNYWAVYKHRGAVYELLKNDSAAINDYSKSIELNEKDTSVFLLRASLYEKTNLHSLAAADFQSVIELDTTNVLVLQKKGEACLRAGMNEDAIIALDALLKLDPTVYDAYYYRGQAWLNTGDVANACGNWKIAQHKPSERLAQAIKKHCKKYDTKLIKKDK